MKQTAVEWLYKLSKKRELDKFDLQQAKVMEKEQIENAYSLSRCEWNKIISSSEYYNDTYGGKK